ncbi:MAG TPA: ATP-binding protein [Sedimentisphaerales bacterium]|nr:ATP-binding protein [Sedimentisphaerales bacterium]
MANTTYTSSSRRRIMVVFLLAIALVGVSTAMVLYPILSAALIREGLSEDAARDVARHVWRIQAGLALATMSIAALAAAWLARTTTRSLQRLLAAAAQIGLGRLDTRVAVTGDDEIARLATAFNDMMRKLRESHDQLESTVRERTAELTQRNDELQTQVVERWRAEEDLKESLSLLKATLESTADGILVVDGRGKIKDYNEPFQRLWRLPEEVLATRDDDAALAAATPLLTDPEAFVTRVRGLYSRPKEEGNGTLHFKDGRVVEYYSKPQSVGDRITGRVWSFRDVTKAYRAKQEQDRLLHQIAAINEELSHFAYVVSHDLKAPLRGIKMLAEWLATDCRDRLGDDARENLDLLQNRVDRMHNLIDGILQYSRIGRITEDLVPVDLNALLPEIIDAIAPPEHITIRIDGRLPVIEAEKTRITQVFQNLLTNAVKYMDKPKGEVVVACSQDPDAWTFSVSDNGPGIEQKYFDRIFKIFQTLTPRDQFESTGVGLALVKKIVEQYGGRVWVVSQVGKGSTFCFTFPKRRTPASEPADTEMKLHR